MAGQLARLHLDRLLRVLTRIERSHKLLQRWRRPCGFFTGMCLVLGGGWEGGGIEDRQAKDELFRGRGAGREAGSM